MASLTLIPEEKNCLSSNDSIKNSNNMNLPCALNKRKTLHPLLSRTSISITSNRPKYVNVAGDRSLPKRLLSAKDHKLKQIQNQLADAHFHLNELTNENRLLRNLQKRMDSALHRYENSSGEIPNILHRHNEEIRSWQVRYKQLKIQSKDTAQKLKDKEAEYQQLKDEHKHLTMLSNDVNLGEREKLQNQVIDLTEKLNRQNETISMLQRKLNLETKSYKHQLHVEMVKHRETQFQLNESLSSNERLTALLEKKEKIIASNLTRRSPKINYEKNMNRSYGFGNSKSLLNLMLPLKESSIPDSEDSTAFSSKLEDSSGSTTFVINEKLVAKEIFQKNNYTNGVKEISTRKSNTSLSDEQNSVKTVLYDKNLDVKERVDTLKNNLRKQNNLFKHKTKTSNNYSDDVASSIDSSPEMMQKTNSYIETSADNYSSEDSVKNQSTHFDFDDLNKTIDELEKESAKERDLVEELIDGFCDEVIEKAETATKVADKLNDVKKSNTNDTSIREVNNNTNMLNKKNVRDLDDEKKKKLLATLKAIDRGDDDGLKIESLRKTKIRSKIMHK